MFKKHLGAKLLIILTLTVGLGFLFAAPDVFAQNDITDGLNTVGEQSGLGNGDIRLIIGRIINIALSFLGIIAVCIVLYGGFTWMTAAGNQEKVDRAKRILTNGAIGLTIIFLSWAITAFVFNALINATGTGAGSGAGSGGSGGGGVLGGGSSSSFAIASVRPEGEQEIRNIAVQATFSRNVSEESVTEESFQVVQVDNQIEVAGEISVSGNKITFIPDAACPDPNGDRKCFEPNTPYEIRLHVDIESSTGVNLLQCSPICVYSFTSGEIVDTEDPVVNIALPDNNDKVAIDSLVGVQVEATDDFAVGVADFSVEETLFDSVAASGADLRDVLISTNWNTSDPFATQVGERYQLEVVATDLAGNTDSDTISVRVIPAWCANGQLDDQETPPEEGIDCGGLCGACEGGVCSDDSDCAGSCVQGICVDVPEITDVTPRDGAPGTYVTITGTGFRNTTGTVYFSDGAGGTIAATIPACAAGWGNSEIVVEVPLGAGDGPIVVQTSNGLSDVTNNDIGPLVEDFDVNDILRPGLCRISPNRGSSNSFTQLIGNAFGQSADVVTFTNSQGQETAVRTYASWSNSLIDLTVPALEDGRYDVSVTSNGVSSNALGFFVGSPLSDAPTIREIAPTEGGPGQYVTIDGSNFGGSIGLVWFENTLDGTTTIADTSFPNACGSDFWTNDQVIVKVPTVTSGAYNLFIERASDGVESNRTSFDVTTAAPLPGICSIAPLSGAAGDQVSITGENFGTQTGSVEFYNEVGATIVSWNSGNVTAEVPNAASTGPVGLTANDGGESNLMNFEITAGSEEGDIAGPPGAAYVWRFSTGRIPIAPELVQVCSGDDISAVPSNAFSSDVCVNAVVFAYFNTVMDESTVNENNITVARCDDESCNSLTPVAANVTASSSAASTNFELVPDNIDNRWQTSSTYRVTVGVGASSLDGTPLENPVSWEFTTSASAEDCDIERVVVNPRRETLTYRNEETEFNALPVFGNCQILNSDDFTWSWQVDPSVASFSEGCTNQMGDSCMTAVALAEGQTNVVAESDDSGVSGFGTLTVNFTDPFVDNRWPDCSTACVNAQVGASFNIAMDPASIEVPGAVRLYECETEFCTNLTEISNTASCIDEGSGCTAISINATSNLDTESYHRVVISGSVRSLSGVPLTRTNYGSDYSWTFLTRDDATECTVARIEIEPEDVILNAIGQTQQYVATPFGEPDSCSVAGQRLNGFDYAWNWVDPIDGTSTTDNDIASWVRVNGELLDANKSDIPEGCTSSCLAQGSSAFGAVCGNGLVEYGEECDDGNALFGDGCSQVCLNEGVTGGTCGNAVVDSGEECDDGNQVNGDGCSNRCLNAGSASSGLTCGDGIVSYLPNIGGEECDDGNRSGGDGCSAVCLWEGSESIVNVAAICGNGIIETPYETCDDGNGVSGDGCSNRCLREGAFAGTATGFICGDGAVNRVAATQAGEDCDGQQGCSSQCLWQGSSLAYATPSVCGDGIQGPGELAICEIGATGDGNVDPSQVAVIDDDAAAQVGESGVANQTVRVSLENFSAEANLGLSCTAETDADCPAGLGVDQNGCCTEYPTISAFPNGSNVCLNAAFYIISDKEMDTSSFDDNVFIGLAGGGACPEGHEIYTPVAYNGNNIFAKLWHGIRTFFIRVANAQSQGDCILPIDRVTQVRVGEEYKINFITSALLSPSGQYSLFLQGGVDGVKTASGVAMPSDIIQLFGTGTEICALSEVEIQDQTIGTPGLFTRFDDTHDMLAVPYTQVTGVRSEIQPVSGIYEWNWRDWVEDSDGAIFDVTIPDAANRDRARVTPQGVNGEATLVAQAEIVENGAATGRVVAGDLDLTALLCENPWPSAGLFPFEDTQDGLDRGITGLSDQPAWMNFATYYCRDTENNGVLPGLSIVSAADPGADEVIKEYFFAVGSSNDVIGIRIASNPTYLSPIDWYRDQGFNGNPSPTTVDGFQAVEDGRTIYVGAPNENEDGAQLYSNIYVISYNAGAEEETVEIYNQLLENWNFAVNVNDINLCFGNGAYTGSLCTSDLDCNIGAGEFCASDKDKLQRDTKRLADLSTIENVMSVYGAQNRLCSATTSQTCTTNGDCPAGESCVASYPMLPSGTFVRAFDASAWSSWTDTLGAEVGGMPSDPLNQYYACGEGTANPDYDAATCVNQSTGAYICPVNSHVYHYRSQGPFRFNASVELEYQSQSNSIWVNPIDQNTADNLVLRAGNAQTGSGAGFSSSPIVCSNATFGDSDACGDGIVGATEACEIGQVGSGALCDANGDGTVDGSRATVCNNSCTGFVQSDAAECVAFSCGNGVIDPGESCDDGSLNGTYGFCNNSCSRVGFFCGDGRLAGGEVCDCGSTTVSGVAVGGGACTVLNGVYQSNPNNSCAWDCGGPAAFCGDGIVNAGEQCDGSNDTWNGELCSTGSRTGQQCTSNADCAGGMCGSPSTGVRPWADSCPATTVCLSGANQGGVCASDSDCPGSSCSTFTVETTRTRTCADNGAGGEVCRWNEPTWRNIACKASGSCGDGVIDAGEECDDGNENNSDQCTNICTLNVCGDGFLYSGVEQCDSGNGNGLACSAAYGSSCTYCSSSCTVLSSSGAFCGDGVRNGGEFCDGADMQYYWTVGTQILGTCQNLGATSGNRTCRNPGVCNGGTNNGDLCLRDQQCGGGSCVFPSCSNSCTASCPFTYANAQTDFLDNQVGATRSSTISLLSSTETEDAEVLGDPNAATLYVPACRVVDSVIVDVDSSNRNLPSVDIMFVLDISQSMDDPGVLAGTTPLAELQDAMIDTIDALYAAYAGEAAAIRTGWTYIGDTHPASSKTASTGSSSGGSTGGSGGTQGPVPSGNTPSGGGTGGGTGNLPGGGGTGGQAPPETGGLEVFESTTPRVTLRTIGQKTSRLFGKIMNHFEVMVALAVSPNDAPGVFVKQGLTTSEQVMTTSILNETDVVASQAGTPIYDSVLDAWEQLDQSTADLKYMVIFTDGNIWNGDYDELDSDHFESNTAIVTEESYMRGVSTLIDDIKADGIKVFSAVLTTNACDVSQMARWSNMACVPNGGNCSGKRAEGNYTCSIPEDGTQYAYSAQDAEGFAEMYREIVASIVGVSVNLTFEGQTVTANLNDGAGQRIPLPPTFSCDESQEQEVVLNLSFVDDTGTGTVELSNPRLNYCAP